MATVEHQTRHGSYGLQHYSFTHRSVQIPLPCLFVNSNSHSEKADPHYPLLIYFNCSIPVHVCQSFRIVNLYSTGKNFINCSSMVCIVSLLFSFRDSTHFQTIQVISFSSTPFCQILLPHSLLCPWILCEVLWILHYLDYSHYLIKLYIVFILGNESLPTLFFTIVFAILNLLSFHINFRFSMSISTSYHVRIFVRIALSL